ncbi:DsbA family oxidoreductase [Empedobacter brevis]|uniref:DsbA family oxidoreductase n=1 Tax=Empedobacter brevis TaxID=247 RepID=A0AAJ1V754_9FLAO|nr:DsbA family oxidoreductase [Empedobacter brevis]MDM1071827.1 DsbA family oxidoreductase [Empedobacter brevis]
MKIEIWSDVMCPFCYIGKKHFEQALEQISYKENIEVEWKSFQLNPDLSKTEITSVNDYLIQAKGISEEQVIAMNNQLAEMGKTVGIDFQQQHSKVINTGDAHRLIHFAQAKGQGSEAEEILFKAYFTEGKNIADTETLAELGEEIGLNKTEILDMLNSDENVFEVASDILDARNIGVSGVPFFVIDRKYAISGAQAVEYFVSALTQAYEKDHLKDAENGASCDVEGNCD